MDLWSGLQTLLGGDSSSAKMKTESGTGASRRHEEALMQKNAKLKEQLDAANARIAELEDQLSRVNKESTKVEQNFDAQTEGAVLQTAETTVQIQDMIQSLNEKLQQLEIKTDRQIKQLSENTERQLAQLKGTAEQMDRIEVAVQQAAAAKIPAVPTGELQGMTEQLVQIRLATDQIGEIKAETGQIASIKSVADQIGEIKSATDQIGEIKAATDQMGEMKAAVGQIGEMKVSTDRQFGKLSEAFRQMNEMKSVMETLQTEKVSMDQINERADGLKIEIADKIHTENVKCYRNIKSLVTDLEVKMEEMELGEESLTKIRRSFKGMKFFSFFALVDFAALVFFVLYFMGYIIIP